MAEHPLIAIVGPTAAGKSALALRLARRLGGEVVSCDSLQVYRGLDIGSAKPAPAERAGVPHHLIDVADPDEDFSAARYAGLARVALGQIAARGRPALVVGGTGLYLRALLEGLFEGPSRDAPLRRRLESLAERYGDARLHRLLQRVDPEAAARIPVRDRVRVVRALEVFRATRQTLSAHFRRPAAGLRGFRVLTLGLELPRDELRRRVEARTASMFARGLLDEVRGLVACGYARELRPLQSIGYRQALRVLRGELTAEEAQRDIVKDTMRYAKRQMTWYRHQAQVAWYRDPDAAEAAAAGWLLGAEAGG